MIAGEGPHVLDDRCHALDHRHHLAHHFVYLFRGQPVPAFVTQQDPFCRRRDRRQGLVQFMGDTCRHLAQGNQSRRLQQLHGQLARFQKLTHLPEHLVQQTPIDLAYPGGRIEPARGVSVGRRRPLKALLVHLRTLITDALPVCRATVVDSQPSQAEFSKQFLHSFSTDLNDLLRNPRLCQFQSQIVEKPEVLQPIAKIR